MKIIKIVLPLIILVALCFTREANAQRSGVEVWSQTCGNCHSMQPASRYTAKRWESIMVHMKINARLSDEESDAVLEYLKFGASDVSSALPAPAEATNIDAVATSTKVSPTPEVKNQLTKEERNKIKAFINKTEKGKESKEK